MENVYEIIAKFEGFILNNDEPNRLLWEHKYKGVYEYEDINYTDWNCLISACQKAKVIYDEWALNNEEKNKEDMPDYYIQILVGLNNMDSKMTIEALIAFINWFNTKR